MDVATGFTTHSGWAIAVTVDVAAVVGWLASKLAEEHARVRSLIGPPWRKDHQHAAAAALIALHSIT